jgi:hypothetical protein
MKKLIFILYLLSVVYTSYATEQEPDILYYKNQELTLSTGWGHPSPLQTYFWQNNLKYPFSMLSTANYRGHIATWEIENNMLFLKKIWSPEGELTPAHFNIKSKKDTTFQNQMVFADWFSGVIECQLRDTTNYWNTKLWYYFHVKNGMVVNIQILNKKDFDEIKKITSKDNPSLGDNTLFDKYKMLLLNQNYIAYYFRLNGNDTIIHENKGGYFYGNREGSPILSYFSNDHTKWLYNWENYEKNGAPNCQWIVREKKVYLTKIELHSGTGFYSIDKDSVNLDVFFRDKIDNNMVLADWLSGIYVMSFGKQVEDDLLKGYFRYKTEEYVYLRLNKGEIVETYTIPSSFNFKKIPKDTPKGLKRIIKEFGSDE